MVLVPGRSSSPWRLAVTPSATERSSRSIRTVSCAVSMTVVGAGTYSTTASELNTCARALGYIIDFLLEYLACGMPSGCMLPGALKRR